MDDLFLKNISRLIDRARDGVTVYTSFLSEEERLATAHLFRKSDTVSHKFFGGFSDPQRCVAAFFDRYEPNDFDFPITVLKISVSDNDASLRHGDILGSILAAGVKRSAVGDIKIDGATAYAAVTDGIAGFLVAEIGRVSRYSCSVTALDKGTVIENAPEFDDVGIIISSNRLDCYISAICRFSREKSIEYIKCGNVKVNDTEVYAFDKRLNKDDRLSLRGFGKFIIAAAPENCNLTHKGRLRIEIKKYL